MSGPQRCHWIPEMSGPQGCHWTPGMSLNSWNVTGPWHVTEALGRQVPRDVRTPGMSLDPGTSGPQRCHWTAHRFFSPLHSPNHLFLICTLCHFNRPIEDLQPRSACLGYRCPDSVSNTSGNRRTHTVWDPKDSRPFGFATLPRRRGGQRALGEEKWK